MKVRKAIIPAAGLGTRFLPITKSVPKEMLPIIDKPTIQFIVEDAVKSGIEDILIIISSSKSSILNYFDYSFQLEENLKNKSKFKDIYKIKEIADIANVQFIIQKKPLGLGDAIMMGKNFVNNEPFAILLGDDILINDHNPTLKQCIDIYNRTKSSVLGVQYVNDSDVNKYGIIGIKKNILNSVFEVSSVIEKPSIKDKPSNYAIIGRYVFNPEIFDEISKVNVDSTGEIQLTPAINSLLSKQKVYSKNIEGKRYDIGSKLGFIKAVIDFGMDHDEIKHELKEYLKSINDI
ncbi:UTP--glucose-1-phosphate uridylyltransferase GalU [Malacoplasma muris]|uniref:UTP--glucose-1-phosphate uridylyltransferase GalU n=1 Tax=Malacoplasma muris TaxID=2119 RepID=UPI00398E6D01